MCIRDRTCFSPKLHAGQLAQGIVSCPPGSGWWLYLEWSSLSWLHWPFVAARLRPCTRTSCQFADTDLAASNSGALSDDRFSIASFPNSHRDHTDELTASFRPPRAFKRVQMALRGSCFRQMCQKCIPFFAFVHVALVSDGLALQYGLTVEVRGAPRHSQQLPHCGRGGRVSI